MAWLSELGEEKNNMEITRITAANADSFKELAPEGAFTDEELLWLGAVAEDGAACAVLGGGIHEGMGFVDWIYTAPDYREKGAADGLLKAFSSLLKGLDAESVEIRFPDTDEELYEFLEGEGFLITEDADRYSVPLEELIYSETIERMEEGRNPSGKIIRAAELMDPQPFYEYLRINNIPCSVKKEELRGYSFILLNDEDKITGCMLVVKDRDGDIEIPYLINEGPMECINDLFLALKNLVMEKGWEEEDIVFADRSGQMIRFVEQITDEDRDSYVIGGFKMGIRLN